MIKKMLVHVLVTSLNPSDWITEIIINRIGIYTVNYWGIKQDFPFINICKVPMEVLKTEGEARGFQPSRGTLRMLMNDKIMFDC